MDDPNKNYTEDTQNSQNELSNKHKKMKKDYRFWLGIISLIISIIAIIATQFRPIFYNIFDKSVIGISVDIENLNIKHDFGRLVFVQCMQVKNTGKAEGTISKIHYYIEKVGDKNFHQTLKVQNYLYDLNDDPTGSFSTYPIFDIHLYYGGYFNGKITAYKSLNKEEQNQHSKLRNEISSSIKRQKELSILKPQISDTLETAVINLIDKNLSGFTIGEYNLLIVAYDKDEQPITPTRYYSFTVFETDIDKMKEITNEYKFGGNNIYYHYTKYKEVGFSTRLTVNKDETIIRRLRENLIKNSE
jgi:hypothetical protein